MTPYSRSKQALEKEGYLVARTEHWNGFARIRQDLYGIIDMVAIKEGHPGVLGVQTTSGDHVMDHFKKALANKALPVWLKTGNRFEIHGWRKILGEGSRPTWQCRNVVLNESHFN